MNWNHCRNILIIRADNIGDLIMSSPAIRAAKEHFNARITVLTSGTSASTASMLPFIDEFLVAELPWVKKDNSFDNLLVTELVDKLKRMHFDGCIIFSVYSQSSLPAALLAWLAGIPLRLAYCRENPYELLTHWIPEKEPYSFIRHQVKRDIALVNSIGIPCNDDKIILVTDDKTENNMRVKIRAAGLNLNKPFILFHAAVSEPKRLFPAEKWAMLINQTLQSFQIPVYLTGSDQDRNFNDDILMRSDNNAVSLSGMLNIPELTALIRHASLLVSVNTGMVHISAGVQTPVVVLYAQTNPQHRPWKTPNRVLEFSIPDELKSRNEVIRYVNSTYYRNNIPLPEIPQVISAMESIIRQPVGFPALRPDGSSGFF